MEKFKKLGKIAIPVMAMAMMLLPFLAFAVTLNPGDQPLPGDAITLSEIRDIIQKVAQFLIVVGVIIAVIMIIWGGILWITGGGGERTKKGQDTVKNGIIGAIIVLGVGVILQTIALIVSRSVFD